MCNNHFSTLPVRGAHREIQCPNLFGIRKSYRGKVGVRFFLFWDDSEIFDTNGTAQAGEYQASYTMQRSIHKWLWLLPFPDRVCLQSDEPVLQKHNA